MSYLVKIDGGGQRRVRYIAVGCGRIGLSRVHIWMNPVSHMAGQELPSARSPRCLIDCGLAYEVWDGMMKEEGIPR